MSLRLIAAILAVSVAPIFAQAQQPNAVKLQAEAENFVKIISADKRKSQTVARPKIHVVFRSGLCAETIFIARQPQTLG